ncbi:putative sodium-coupled neutral amino acid transporter 11 [Rhipicephalus sanguineus]|uniref:putative sodium-coupled neutral amino acid transporter 11 n=1 Tax=Rhipicephalus sanguineus TaxID=34632 RepID=UPI001894C847|nr:putative sodium-coupled neutral amino acid transporter 11 [Rhipicephalus sanguineus]
MQGKYTVRTAELPDEAAADANGKEENGGKGAPAKEDNTAAQETSSLLQTSFNYINSIIGSGVVGIAYALQQAGFGMGLILLVMFAAITDYSLCILIKAGISTGTSTYQDLVQAAFGLPGFYVLTFMQFIYPFIAMISYNVIIGDTVTKVFLRVFSVAPDSILSNRHFIVIMASMFVTLPLSLLRNISKLNKVSLTSLLIILAILTFVIVRIGNFVGTVPSSPDSYAFANRGITKAIGVIAFAYMCHHNSFLLFAALKDPTQRRWNKVTHISLSLSCVIIVLFGIGGYVSFHVYSQGDLFENYCKDDDLANVARLLFTLTIMLTYPIECFVTREVLDNAFFVTRFPSNLVRHIIMTLFIVLTTFAFSTLTDCLGIVLELNGVLAAIPLAYILPAATYLKLENGPLLSWAKFPALMLAVCGAAVAICGTVVAIIDINAGISCSHGADMPYCTVPAANVTV